MRPTESERIAVVSSINSCTQFGADELVHMLERDYSCSHKQETEEDAGESTGFTEETGQAFRYEMGGQENPAIDGEECLQRGFSAEGGSVVAICLDA